jgi:hypothetical protein
MLPRAFHGHKSRTAGVVAAFKKKTGKRGNRKTAGKREIFKNNFYINFKIYGSEITACTLATALTVA